MRKFIIVGAIAALVSATSPAKAAINLTHFAPLPCAVMCAYWDVPNTAGYNECDVPFPEGSYDQTLMRMTSQSGTVHIEAQSVIDYDTFICTNTTPSFLVVSMANIIAEDCDGLAGRNAVAIGCLEVGDLTYSALLSANGGVNADEFIIRSYNWSDNGVLPITVTGPAVVIDDSYQAACPAAIC